MPRCLQPLRLGNGVDGQRGLTRRLWTEYFYNPAAWISSYTKGHVQTYAACGYHFHVFGMFVAHPHDGTFAEIFLYLGHSGLKRFQLPLVGCCGRAFCLFFFVMVIYGYYSSKSPSNTSCQGNPCLFSCSMKGSESKSSTFQTPGFFQMPFRNIMAPIMAGTPVV